jgi:hypothetical protein
MHAGGRIYWRTSSETTLTSLDVGSMEFSHVPLPGNLSRYAPYALGDTEDGTTCIVSASTRTSCRLNMQLWFLKGSSSWELQWGVDASHLVAGRIHEVKVTAGVVLLSTGYKNKSLQYIGFSLKDAFREGTTKLADFFASAGWVHPYFMAWPRPTLKVHALSFLIKHAFSFPLSRNAYIYSVQWICFVWFKIRTSKKKSFLHACSTMSDA